MSLLLLLSLVVVVVAVVVVALPTTVYLEMLRRFEILLRLLYFMQMPCMYVAWSAYTVFSRIYSCMFIMCYYPA